MRNKIFYDVYDVPWLLSAFIILPWLLCAAASIHLIAARSRSASRLASASNTFPPASERAKHKVYDISCALFHYVISSAIKSYSLNAPQELSLVDCWRKFYIKSRWHFVLGKWNEILFCVLWLSPQLSADVGWINLITLVWLRYQL